MNRSRRNAMLRRRRLRRQKQIIHLQAEGEPREIEFTGDASFDLEALADDSKKPSFAMKAYTGGVMRPRNFYGAVAVDLQGMEVPRRSVPILRNHDQDRIVGHGRVAIEGKNITVDGEFSGVGNDREEVLASARNGFPWQASIGAVLTEMEFVREGNTARVNGSRVSGPVYIARASRLNEVSFVAVGADTGNRVSVAAATSNGGLPMNFEQWLKAEFALEAAALTEEQRPKFEAKYQEWLAAQGGDGGGDGDDTAAGGEGDDTVGASAGDDGDGVTIEGGQDAGVQAIRTGAAGELQRIGRIRELTGDDHPEIQAQAVSEGWTPERTENAVLTAQVRQLRESRPQATPAIHDAARGRENQLAIECALGLYNEGINGEQAIEAYGEQVVERASQADMRGYTLHRYMHHVLQCAGMSHPVGQHDDEFIRKVFQAGAKLEAAGFSTVSLPGILSNVLNKRLLASYNLYPSVIPFYCYIASANDFKPFYSYRLEGGDEAILRKLGADGTIAHMNLVEQEYMNQVETYARMIALTRQMLRNDDLGALNQAAGKLGEAAYKAHEYAGITLLKNPPLASDGLDFFHANHNNLISGADSALGIDGLTNADAAFGQQVDSAGYPISVEPERLLVPRTLRILAGQLMGETRIEIAGTADRTELANNPHAGAYDYRSSPWMENAKIASASSIEWYLFANPNSLAAFEVAYLSGARAPVIQSADADFNQLGVQLRSYWDFGFAAQDYRGAVKSEGQ